MKRPPTHAAAALLMGTWLAYAAAAKEPELRSLSAEHFTQTASVTEEVNATRITTEHGYVERSGLMGEVWHDEFLTALIDRESGRLTYEVDVSLTYRGAARSFVTAEFRGLEQLESVPIKILKRRAINCPTGECIYTDNLAIPIDETLLRHIAQGYDAGKPELWGFHILTKGAADYRGAISNAEAAGLLAKVDGYRRNPAAAQAPAPPPARLNFGISGLPVAASSGAPDRAGVIVVGVSPGSIAENAGLITGDIIYDFEGRSIRSPGDLQAAVTAAASRPIAHIKVYRGNDAITLEAPF